MKRGFFDKLTRVDIQYRLQKFINRLALATSALQAAG